ncbi:anti-sigma-I factor RsgI2-like isoform X2 [Labeo rohita]|uniref:anti-sigma-I factor RsgI2-like isoform X2 n=1 Tax=Labeo rohita TaxID=84645 RepID=UPI0021E22CCB|nr:anti-sigma-I factor RsgI2-like isoform X2 [Labeo rohita]
MVPYSAIAPRPRSSKVPLSVTAPRPWSSKVPLSVTAPRPWSSKVPLSAIAPWPRPSSVSRSATAPRPRSSQVPLSAIAPWPRPSSVSRSATAPRPRSSEVPLSATALRSRSSSASLSVPAPRSRPTCSTWTWPSIPPPVLPLFPHPPGLLFERQESLLGGGDSVTPSQQREPSPQFCLHAPSAASTVTSCLSLFKDSPCAHFFAKYCQFHLPYQAFIILLCWITCCDLALFMDS